MHWNTLGLSKKTSNPAATFSKKKKNMKLKFENLPKWAKVIITAILIMAAAVTAVVEMTACSSMHAVSQSFVQRGDTMVMIRYEQVGNVKK